MTSDVVSQWNPCRSRGARRPTCRRGSLLLRLSGTPAEAGVRDESAAGNHRAREVSVEPLPKQGCEQLHTIKYHIQLGWSQWNPCRSRGASPHLECLDIAWGIGTFIHPPANLIVFCGFKEHLRDCSSNYYCLSSGSVFIHPSIRFLYPRFQSEVRRPALIAVRAGRGIVGRER